MQLGLQPQKEDCAGLWHLLEDETIDLLKSAGYAFSDGSKRDWIVRYCLEHKIYNINQVNTLLFEYDQEQLGA